MVGTDRIVLEVSNVFQASPGSTNSAVHLATATSSPEVWRRRSASTTEFATGISGSPYFHDSADASEYTPRSSLSHANSFLDLSRESSNLEVASPASLTIHNHWCTVCENPSAITTCDGWKRHEKEQHEKGYICMPNGPREATGSGLHCAFCRLSNPSQSHLEKHNTRQCVHKSSNDRRYTRKFQLINHLKTHGMFEASALADRWRVSLKKNFYACGFCVCIFSTNGDRLNHIDSHHYRRFQHINDWDPNMVIRGLLLQPDILAFWREICPWDPDPRHANLTWGPHTVTALQVRLELSEEPAHQLATDVLCLSSVRSTRDIQAAALPSVSKQQPDNYEGLSVEQQSHTTRTQLASYQSFDTQGTDQTSLHFQARNLPWNATETNVTNPVRVHVPTPQSLISFSDSETATDGLSHAMTLSPWQTNGPINNPMGNQSSQDSSNTRAAAVPHFKSALGQLAPTSLERWQCSSPDYAITSNSSDFSPPSVYCVAESGKSGKSGRPGPSPSTHGCPSTSFSTVTTMTGPAKPPSIGAKVKRRLSRIKMGIDVDDVMLHMQDDESSRSEWPANRRSR